MASFLPLAPSVWKEHASQIENRFTYSSIAGIGLLLQVGLLYYMNSIYKNDPGWDDGSILSHFLSLGMYTRPLGEWFLTWPSWILNYLTIAVLYFERVAPLLLLLPYASMRLVIVLMLMAMHIAFGSAMSVGFYVFMCLVWLAALLPPLFWDRVIPTSEIKLKFPRPLQLREKMAAALIVFMILTNYAGYIYKSSWTKQLKAMTLLQEWGNFTGKNIAVGHPLFLVTENGQQIDLYRRYISHLPETEIVLYQPKNAPALYGSWGLLNIFDWRRDIHRKFIENISVANDPVREKAFEHVARSLCNKANRGGVL